MRGDEARPGASGDRISHRLGLCDIKLNLFYFEIASKTRRRRSILRGASPASAPEAFSSRIGERRKLQPEIGQQTCYASIAWRAGASAIRAQS